MSDSKDQGNSPPGNSARRKKLDPNCFAAIAKHFNPNDSTSWPQRASPKPAAKNDSDNSSSRDLKSSDEIPSNSAVQFNVEPSHASRDNTDAITECRSATDCGVNESVKISSNSTIGEKSLKYGTERCAQASASFEKCTSCGVKENFDNIVNGKKLGNGKRSPRKPVPVNIEMLGNKSKKFGKPVQSSRPPSSSERVKSETSISEMNRKHHKVTTRSASNKSSSPPSKSTCDESTSKRTSEHGTKVDESLAEETKPVSIVNSEIQLDLVQQQDHEIQGKSGSKLSEGRFLPEVSEGSAQSLDAIDAPNLTVRINRSDPVMSASCSDEACKDKVSVKVEYKRQYENSAFSGYDDKMSDSISKVEFIDELPGIKKTELEPQQETSGNAACNGVELQNKVSNSSIESGEIPFNDNFKGGVTIYNTAMKDCRLIVDSRDRNGNNSKSERKLSPREFKSRNGRRTLGKSVYQSPKSSGIQFSVGRGKENSCKIERDACRVGSKSSLNVGKGKNSSLKSPRSPRMQGNGKKDGNTSLNSPPVQSDSQKRGIPSLLNLTISNNAENQQNCSVNNSANQPDSKETLGESGYEVFDVRSKASGTEIKTEPEFTTENQKNSNLNNSTMRSNTDRSRMDHNNATKSHRYEKTYSVNSNRVPWNKTGYKDQVGCNDHNAGSYHSNFGHGNRPLNYRRDNERSSQGNRSNTNVRASESAVSVEWKGDEKPFVNPWIGENVESVELEAARSSSHHNTGRNRRVHNNVIKSTTNNITKYEDWETESSNVTSFVSPMIGEDADTLSKQETWAFCREANRVSNSVKSKMSPAKPSTDYMRDNALRHESSSVRPSVGPQIGENAQNLLFKEMRVSGNLNPDSNCNVNSNKHPSNSTTDYNTVSNENRTAESRNDKLSVNFLCGEIFRNLSSNQNQASFNSVNRGISLVNFIGYSRSFIDYNRMRNEDWAADIQRSSQNLWLKEGIENLPTKENKSLSSNLNLNDSRKDCAEDTSVENGSAELSNVINPVIGENISNVSETLSASNSLHHDNGSIATSMHPAGTFADLFNGAVNPLICDNIASVNDNCKTVSAGVHSEPSVSELEQQVPEMCYLSDAGSDLKMISDAGNGLVLEAGNDLVLEAGNGLALEAGNDLAGNGLVLEAGNDLVSEASNDLVLEADNDLVLEAGNDLVLEAGNDLVSEASNDLVLEADNDLVLEAGNNLKMTWKTGDMLNRLTETENESNIISETENNDTSGELQTDIGLNITQNIIHEQVKNNSDSAISIGDENNVNRDGEICNSSQVYNQESSSKGNESNKLKTTSDISKHINAAEFVPNMPRFPVATAQESTHFEPAVASLSDSASHIPFLYEKIHDLSLSVLPADEHGAALNVETVSEVSEAFESDENQEVIINIEEQDGESFDQVSATTQEISLEIISLIELNLDSNLPLGPSTLHEEIDNVIVAVNNEEQLENNLNELSAHTEEISDPTAAENLDENLDSHLLQGQSTVAEDLDLHLMQGQSTVAEDLDLHMMQGQSTVAEDLDLDMMQGQSTVAEVLDLHMMQGQSTVAEDLDLHMMQGQSTVAEDVDLHMMQGQSTVAEAHEEVDNASSTFVKTEELGANSLAVNDDSVEPVHDSQRVLTEEESSAVNNDAGQSAQESQELLVEDDQSLSLQNDLTSVDQSLSAVVMEECTESVQESVSENNQTNIDNEISDEANSNRIWDILFHSSKSSRFIAPQSSETHSDEFENSSVETNAILALLNANSNPNSQNMNAFPDSQDLNNFQNFQEANLLSGSVEANMFSNFLDGNAYAYIDTFTNDETMGSDTLVNDDILRQQQQMSDCNTWPGSYELYPYCSLPPFWESGTSQLQDNFESGPIPLGEETHIKSVFEMLNHNYAPPSPNSNEEFAFQPEGGKAESVSVPEEGCTAHPSNSLRSSDNSSANLDEKRSSSEASKDEDKEEEECLDGDSQMDSEGPDKEISELLAGDPPVSIRNTHNPKIHLRSSGSSASSRSTSDGRAAAAVEDASEKHGILGVLMAFNAQQKKEKKQEAENKAREKRNKSSSHDVYDCKWIKDSDRCFLKLVKDIQKLEPVEFYPSIDELCCAVTPSKPRLVHSSQFFNHDNISGRSVRAPPGFNHILGATGGSSMDSEFRQMSPESKQSRSSQWLKVESRLSSRGLTAQQMEARPQIYPDLLIGSVANSRSDWNATRPGLVSSKAESVVPKLEGSIRPLMELTCTDQPILISGVFDSSVVSKTSGFCPSYERGLKSAFEKRTKSDKNTARKFGRQENKTRSKREIQGAYAASIVDNNKKSFELNEQFSNVEPTLSLSIPISECVAATASSECVAAAASSECVAAAALSESVAAAALSESVAAAALSESVAAAALSDCIAADSAHPANDTAELSTITESFNFGRFFEMAAQDTKEKLEILRARNNNADRSRIDNIHNRRQYFCADNNVRFPRNNYQNNYNLQNSDVVNQSGRQNTDDNNNLSNKEDFGSFFHHGSNSEFNRTAMNVGDSCQRAGARDMSNSFRGRPGVNKFCSYSDNKPDEPIRRNFQGGYGENQAANQGNQHHVKSSSVEEQWPESSPSTRLGDQSSSLTGSDSTRNSSEGSAGTVMMPFSERRHRDNVDRGGRSISLHCRNQMRGAYGGQRYFSPSSRPESTSLENNESGKYGFDKSRSSVDDLYNKNASVQETWDNSCCNTVIVKKSNQSGLSRHNSSPDIKNGDYVIDGDWKNSYKEQFFIFNEPFIDSHCHIDLIYRHLGCTGTFKDFRNTFSDTFPLNYAGCVSVFCHPSFWPGMVKGSNLFEQLLEEPGIYAAVGCHPKNALTYNALAEAALCTALLHPKVKALGEIGLDYSKGCGQFAAQQKDVLTRQAKIAKELNMPIVIHSRDAETDILAIMQELVPSNYRIHRHCYLGSWSEAKLWLEKFPQSYIGLTPAITSAVNINDDAREVATNIPLDRLLLETDAPYFVPRNITKRIPGMDHSHPGMAITVAVEVAKLKNISVGRVLEACYENTKRMYDISEDLTTVKNP